MEVVFELSSGWKDSAGEFETEDEEVGDDDKDDGDDKRGVIAVHSVVGLDMEVVLEVWSEK